MTFFAVHKNSSDCIKSILNLHFKTGPIIDVNFGNGVFYKKIQNRKIIGIDVLKKGNIVADNRKLPFKNNCFDVGICDPPYKRGPRNVLYTKRYGKAPYTDARVTNSYFDLFPELIRVSRIGIIAKCQDGTDGHRFYMRHIKIIEFVKDLIGLEPHDIAITARFGGPNHSLNGKQRYFQQCFSYFLVWKWKTKNPFKPFRY